MAEKVRFSAVEQAAPARPAPTPEQLQRQDEERHREWSEKWHRKHKMRPETRAALNRELVRHKVDHLPEGHPDRRRVVADWAARIVKENIAMAKMRWK